jgi:hypothetical protein
MEVLSMSNRVSQTSLWMAGVLFIAGGLSLQEARSDIRTIGVCTVFSKCNDCDTVPDPDQNLYWRCASEQPLKYCDDSLETIPCWTKAYICNTCIGYDSPTCTGDEMATAASSSYSYCHN